MGKENQVKILLETLQKTGQLKLTINILKKLSGEIKKGDYKYKQKFFQKKSTDSFTHEHLTSQSYLDINDHTSMLFEIFKFNCSHQK